jgi:hypothetical protein
MMSHARPKQRGDRGRFQLITSFFCIHFFPIQDHQDLKEKATEREKERDIILLMRICCIRTTIKEHPRCAFQK